MSTKRKNPHPRKPQAEPRQQPAQGMITPPEIVSGLIVRQTIGEDLVFGHCSHALQLLPNSAILLLVTSVALDGATEVDTFLIGEEVSSFKARKSMIETSDAPA